VPGSYAIEIRARVPSEHGPDRCFSLLRIKRPEPEALIRTLRELGWVHVDGWRYGDSLLALSEIGPCGDRELGPPHSESGTP
jgi:hypothetical protein